MGWLLFIVVAVVLSVAVVEIAFGPPTDDEWML